MRDSMAPLRAEHDAVRSELGALRAKQDGVRGELHLINEALGLIRVRQAVIRAE